MGYIYRCYFCRYNYQVLFLGSLYPISLCNAHNEIREIGDLVLLMLLGRETGRDLTQLYD